MTEYELIKHLEEFERGLEERFRERGKPFQRRHETTRSVRAREKRDEARWKPRGAG